MAIPFKLKKKKKFDFGNKGNFNFKKDEKYKNVTTDYDDDSIAERKANDGSYRPKPKKK